MTRFRILFSATMLLSISSCDVLGPEPTIVAGALSFHQQLSTVTVPDSVTSGTAFEVGVETFGGVCLIKERTDATVNGMVADVIVYDKDTGESPCAAILLMNRHRTTITFAQTGVGTVRFHGWRVPENTSFVIDRTVVVR